MSIYTERINKFQQGMADIKIMRHPLRKEFIVILNDREVDIYQDVHVEEKERLKKWGVLKKDPELEYVRYFEDEILLDETDKPWVCYFTTTGLPRKLRKDDYLLVEGHKYAISSVKPINRDRDSLMVCLVYPERSEIRDELKIYRIEKLLPGGWSIIYGGNPQLLKIDDGPWRKFKSILPFNSLVEGSNLTIRDDSQGISEIYQYRVSIEEFSAELIINYPDLVYKVEGNLDKLSFRIEGNDLIGEFTGNSLTIVDNCVVYEPNY